MRLNFNQTGLFLGYEFDQTVIVDWLSPKKRMNPDDIESVPSGTVLVTIKTPSVDSFIVSESALDAFHLSYGIKVLEDFNIEPEI